LNFSNNFTEMSG